jgi:Rrf2 family protein
MAVLSHKSILGISAVVDIALYSRQEPVTAGDLAERFHLPRRYLEPVLHALVRNDILVGVRGPQGGYALAHARHAISVYEILQAVKTVEAERRAKDLPGFAGAVVLPVLAQAEHLFASALKRISVEDLVRSATLQGLANHAPALEKRTARRNATSAQRKTFHRH